MSQSNAERRILGPVVLALLAAILYGISSPFSKLLLERLPPTLLAALLYLGAGIGMSLVQLARRASATTAREAKFARSDLPFIAGMIVLDIAAPILLMLGLRASTAETASLLNNFEIVATSMVAMVFFREAIGRRLWIAIGLISVASAILSVPDPSRLALSPGALLVLGASVCWGMENNCTRMLSLKDPVQIVVLKGFGSGTGALVIAMFSGAWTFDVPYLLFALLLGFFAYGLGVYFYILAQRRLGAARTSTFYAAAPFIGVLLSWIILREAITPAFVIALLLMGLGAYFVVSEVHRHSHVHDPVVHEHKHTHDDGHHDHDHEPEIVGEHTHVHSHDAVEHQHRHTPDMHHRHRHGLQP
jgi:drug/metabolite transporter (DMT)-like permease